MTMPPEAVVPLRCQLCDEVSTPARGQVFVYVMHQLRAPGPVPLHHGCMLACTAPRFDPRWEVPLSLGTAGDPSVGIFPAHILVVVPGIARELKAEPEQTAWLKAELEKLLADWCGEPVTGAWPWDETD